MDTEFKYFSTVVGFLAVLVLSVSVYNLRELEMKREALAKGASPLEIQCLFPTDAQKAACLVLLGEQK